MALSARLRKTYAKSLARGVPEDVIKEHDTNLTKHIAEWKKQVLAHVKKLSGPKK